jgi:hypothetical protein
MTAPLRALISSIRSAALLRIRESRKAAKDEIAEIACAFRKTAIVGVENQSELDTIKDY